MTFSLRVLIIISCLWKIIILNARLLINDVKTKECRKKKNTNKYHIFCYIIYIFFITLNCNMVKRIHGYYMDTTWMYFHRCAIFTRNTRYISNFIHVDSTIVHERISTRKSTWILVAYLWAATWILRVIFVKIISSMEMEAYVEHLQ